MELNDKIAKLKNLFAEKERIDREIEDLLGEKPVKKPARKPKAKPAKKEEPKPKKRGRSKRAVSEPAAPVSSCANKYYCENCGNAFASVLDLIDVTCPECKNSRITKNK